MFYFNNGINIYRKHDIETTQALLKNILDGDRIALSKGITLVESKNKDHEAFADLLMKGCLDKSGSAIHLGITGTPGVGKSTFVENLGLRFIENGHRVAVLTIDPSSPENQGSILGDKSRMDQLSHHDSAYVRSSPSRTTLGGATDRTRETIVLCEAAGYDVIIVETVGVGQSETEISSLVDIVALLVLPGSGDEIQGIKRGIVEIADLVIINKEDKFDKSVVKESVNAYKFATHLRPQTTSSLPVSVLSSSALTGSGMNEILEKINHLIEESKQKGIFQSIRNRQQMAWLKQRVEEKALQLIQTKLQSSDIFQIAQNDVIEKRSTVNNAASEIINKMMS